MALSGYQTGYFGDESSGRATKVHVVNEKEELLCGLQVGSKMRFHWCGYGVITKYVSCYRCLRKIDDAKELREAEVKETAGPAQVRRSKLARCSCCGQPMPK